MLKAPFPANEAARLRALRALEILDTPAEDRFDRLTRIAQHILQVPIVLISLVDAERQWFKARRGLDASETPRDISFCGHAILGAEIFVVPDAAADERFFDNPLVTQAPDIRFYAGAPLTLSDGMRVGTLCAIDRQPRQLDERQLASLRDLAQCVTDELELNTRLRRLRELSLIQARYAAIIESSEDAIMSKTLDGIVTSWNQAAERMFGYSEHEMLGNSMGRLIPQDLNNEEPQILARIRRGERIEHFETTRRRKSGDVFPVSVTISPIRDGSGAIVGASKIVRDISERKVAERMKSEFVSTVSHELRTPLTSIRGALGLVVGKFSADLPDKVRQLLETANRNSERLTLLINDILDMEKIKSGQMHLDFKKLDLVVLAKQAIVANEGYGQQHGVSLKLIEMPRSAMVRADELRMMQIFANLISNAVKFSPKGASVEVAVRPQDGGFRVSVRDSGSGIPKAFHSRIFQRFAQADSSDSREKGGTGLGLSITQAIIDKHGGAIDFVSEEGVGSEFFFLLPEWQDEVAVKRASRDQPHMLICEPDHENALVLSELLAGEGVTSDWAATTAAAVELLRTKQYRGVLLDVGQPEIDGLSLIQRLRDNEATRYLPVIAVSWWKREDSDVRDVQGLSILDWLQKPVDRQKLRKALTQALLTDHRPRILHVEDDLDVVQVTKALLEEDADYTYAATLAAARSELAHGRFDLLLLDLTLPDGFGLELLSAISPETQVIVFSGQDPGAALKRHLTVSLTKATTSNERLLATIREAITPSRK